MRLHLGLFVALFSLFALGDACQKLSYEICDAGDVPSGSTRYEYLISTDCSTLEIKRFHTDYRCTEAGTFINSKEIALDGKWHHSTETTKPSPEALEYGKTERSWRMFWNENQTTLTEESNVKKDLMIRDIFSDGKKYFPFKQETSSTKKYSREGDLVMERVRTEERYKSPKTYNEWLSSMKENIDGLDPVR